MSEFKGIWIPVELWLDDDLNKIEILFMARIIALDNQDGCYASNAHFAEFFKLSRRRTIDIIQALIDKKKVTAKNIRRPGTMSVEKRIIKAVKKYSSKPRKGGEENFTTPSEIKFTPPSEENCTGVVKKTAKGSEENCTYSNRTSNRVINTLENNSVCEAEKEETVFDKATLTAKKIASPQVADRPPHELDSFEVLEAIAGQTIFEFTEFMEQYGYQAGVSKTHRIWRGLPEDDLAEIKRTVGWYVSDTLPPNQQNSGDWKPKRKMPANYLADRIWEDYKNADGPMLKNKSGKVRKINGRPNRLDINEFEGPKTEVKIFKVPS